MQGRRKILVIDDDEEFCNVVSELLQLNGFAVAQATDPDEGSEIAKKTQPDLILLDILMPKRDGLEVLNILKSDFRTMSIPVVMVTALADDPVKLRASSSYSDDYVTKPVNLDVLLAKIKEVWRRRGDWQDSPA